MDSDADIEASARLCSAVRWWMLEARARGCLSCRAGPNSVSISVFISSPALAEHAPKVLKELKHKTQTAPGHHCAATSGQVRFRVRTQSPG